VDAQEQGSSHLAIGPPLGDQAGDLFLRGRQVRRRSSSAPDPGELSISLRHPRPGAEALEDPACVAEELSGGTLLPHAPVEFRRDQEGSSQLEGVTERFLGLE
jgi:hypothetical protein